jgi:DNA polymerase (family 10)
VGALFHDLGVQSLADLQAALDQGKIATLTGFGKKTEENLRKSIALVAVSEERIHLGKAWDIISNIQEKLMEAGYQGDLWPCGSFRRRRETVGDIDLIAVEGSLENTAVMAAFRSLVEPENVIVSGPTKTSIRWGGRTQVDLRLIAPGSVGAALQYFTGSKDHNVSLRARCERRNWKLNEYGLFDVEEHNLLDSTLAPMAQEKQIYQLLDLPYFPPELRETGLEYSNLREGDLFQLPDLVSEADIVGNLHTHSQWSDGDLTSGTGGGASHGARVSVSGGDRSQPVSDRGQRSVGGTAAGSRSPDQGAERSLGRSGALVPAALGHRVRHFGRWQDGFS